MTRLLAYLPRGNTLDDRAWHKRHVFLQGVLLLHLPVLFVFGLYMGRSFLGTLGVLSVPAACLVFGRLIRHRRVHVGELAHGQPGVADGAEEDERQAHHAGEHRPADGEIRELHAKAFAVVATRT